MPPRVTIIGAGLAGSEAAWQLAARGIAVRLFEMRPEKHTSAHTGGGFAELVCSNSLRSDQLENAVGLLKEEMRLLGSLVMRAADATRVPAGGALAVDRAAFSAYITNALEQHPLVEIVRAEVTHIPEEPCIIASGPLTSAPLADAIAAAFGAQYLSFYDAVAPIVMADSLNMDVVFRASRYGRGDDYLNCPMDEAQYYAFVSALLAAEKAPMHAFEDEKVFEGCMPVEVMAARGPLTLAHGPMKPMGLRDPRTGRRPFAVVQLRQETQAGTMYNLVGFQTRLKFGEQKRVFGMIPGLEHAAFARYGVMHRNTFLNGPRMLSDCYRARGHEALFFAGQMTGVEGYIESAASGLLAALGMVCALRSAALPTLSSRTAIGALAQYVAHGNLSGQFQPMNVTFGIMEPLPARVRGKRVRNAQLAARALEEVRAFVSSQ
nr:methylenetetrahydrofolate--tRNA-(uracil(54)-C(5))-methyltransferase (FADH(2)-oxidizing) TrmFO [Maliibacterium massiliense]